jgi:hypothetical protein
MLRERTEWTGKRLALLLEKTGMTPVDMAAKMDTTVQSIANWLGDKHRMSLVHRRKLDRIERAAQQRAAR